jgi:acyl-CoA reductase-like NAD-dependent aldehyde dehydrogenase
VTDFAVRPAARSAGNGRSGIGREGGRSSLEFYTRPTNVCIEFDHAGA